MGTNLGMKWLAGEEHREVIGGQGRVLMLEKSSSDGGKLTPHPWEVYV